MLTVLLLLSVETHRYDGTARGNSSREPTGRQPRQPRLCGMASTKLDQTVARLGGETTVRGVLATTCRELVELLDATACAVSRVIGDLLVGLDEYTLAARPLEHGHEFLISDYPLTQEVVESGEPRQRVADRSRGRADGGGAAGEARLRVAADGLPAVRGRVLGPRRGLRPRGQLRRGRGRGGTACGSGRGRAPRSSWNRPRIDVAASLAAWQIAPPRRATTSCARIARSASRAS